MTLIPIGTRVIHKDYPVLAGTIVGRNRQPSGFVKHIYLVKWDNGSQTRHIWSALKETSK